MMKTSDGKQVHLNRASLVHDEPAKLGKGQYAGGGRWILEICDMDKDFSKAVGYELFSSDRYMGYSLYHKTVTADVFTGIMLNVSTEGVRYDVRMPIPESLRPEIFKCAELKGDTRLPDEIVRKLAKQYNADDVYNAILNQRNAKA